MNESDNLTPRQLRAAERILEDEGLAGNLVDAQARQLVRWAGEVAVRAAADQHSDEKTSLLLGAIRQVARQAARQAAAEGKDVVELAQQALGAAAPELVDAPAPEPLAPAPQPPAPAPLTIRRRTESLRVRLISLISHRTN